MATTQNVPYSDPASVRANGIEIAYDTFGDPGAPPLLLVSGLSAQMIDWDDEFCAQIAARGYWLIRFDNRDVGLSTKFDEAGAPDILALMQAMAQGKAIQAPYMLRDMADDAVGLLDGLEIESAHVVGASMGGMIAQMMAIHHPERISTLTSIMSTTGDPGLAPPKQEAVTILVTPTPTDREGYLEASVRNQRVLTGPGYPLDKARIREHAERAFDRGIHPAGVGRQFAAIIASGSRKELLKPVTIPTLVIHGDADPLVPVEGGMDTAHSVPGAELLIVKGMGHDLPPAVWPQVVGAIARHAV